MPAARVAIAVAVACLLSSPPARAAADADDDAVGTSPYSLGFQLGDPMALTFRGVVSGRHAIQGVLGYQLFPGDGVTLGADWTWDAIDFLRREPAVGLWLTVGAGLKASWFTAGYFVYHRTIGDAGHFGVGPRAFGGLRLTFRRAPYDLFFEIAPIGFLIITPDAAVFYDFDVAVGFRYRF